MYKIAVTNVNFDRNYDNVLRFNSKTERNTYFGIPAIFENSPTCNFAVSSLLETSVVVRYDAATDLKHLLMCNYAIVQNADKADELYFYFINEARQESGSIITLQLELDIFQTFYQDISFSPCLIRRAHLDRFGAIMSSSGTPRVNFNGENAADNYLFENEDVPEPPKILRSRTKAYPIAFEPNLTAEDVDNKWIADNVRAWMYIYISPGAEGLGTNTYLYTDIAHTQTEFLPDAGYELPSIILCAPIMKYGYAIEYRKANATSTYGDLIGIKAISWIENNSAFIQAIKLSFLPPWHYFGFNGAVSSISVNRYETINERETMIIDFEGDNEAVNDVSYHSASTCIQIHALPLQGYRFSATLPSYDDIFVGAAASGYINVSQIVNATSHDLRLNPKMYAQKYREVRISIANNGDGYSYDQQRLNDYDSTAGALSLRVFENLTPDTSRIFALILAAGDLGYDDAQDAYLGLITSADMSMPYASDMLNEYLAQNKNFYEQAKYNAGMDLAKSMIGVGGNVVKGMTSGGAIGAGISAVQSAATSIISYRQQIQNMQYSADNMRAAPDQLKNANGSALLNISVQDLGLYIELYEPLECDKVRINDVMHRFGFSVEAVGNIKDYDNIRHYFNYVQAEVEEILGDTPVSQAVRDRFKEAFAAGVRFWNASANDVEMYDFGPENYEERLAT